MTGPVSGTQQPDQQTASAHASNTVDDNYEAYVQSVMNRKGVSREVAEAEVQAFY